MMPASGSVTYAAAPSATMMPVSGSIMYAAAPTVTTMPASASYVMPSAGSVTYAAPNVTYAAEPVGTMSYGAPAMTYAAPASYGAPMGGSSYGPMGGQQPVYNISPERFQLIMAGQPLTNEEIMAMTGA